MASPFDSNTKIDIKCPQCGASIKKTIGELQSGTPFSCACGKAFDSAEVTAKAQEAVQRLKEKIGGLNR